jgi:hypothetical protein
MGCGASQEESDDGNRRERRDRSKSKDNNSAAGQKKGSVKSDAKYEDDQPAKKENDDDNADVASGDGSQQVLTAAIMADLRLKSKEMSGGTVQRWADAIAEPGENDAADVYDPVRRHGLAMESLAARYSST